MKVGSIAAVLLISFGASLIGPALLVISRAIGEESALHSFFADLIFLLWPAQVLGVVEHSYGKLVALLVSVGANSFLFMLVGGFGFYASRSAYYVILLGSFVLLGLVLFAMWGAGFDYRYVSTPALVIAAVIYLMLLSASMMLGCQNNLH
jgi:hypothetical protein